MKLAGRSCEKFKSFSPKSKSVVQRAIFFAYPLDSPTFSFQKRKRTRKVDHFRFSRFRGIFIMDLAFDTHFVFVIMKTINAGESGLMLRAKVAINCATSHIKKGSCVWKTRDS
jgi:hypothetical protein